MSVRHHHGLHLGLAGHARRGRGARGTRGPPRGAHRLGAPHAGPALGLPGRGRPTRRARDRGRRGRRGAPARDDRVEDADARDRRAGAHHRPRRHRRAPLHRADAPGHHPWAPWPSTAPRTPASTRRRSSHRATPPSPNASAHGAPRWPPPSRTRRNEAGRPAPPRGLASGRRAAGRAPPGGASPGSSLPGSSLPDGNPAGRQPRPGPRRMSGPAAGPAAVMARRQPPCPPDRPWASSAAGNWGACSPSPPRASGFGRMSTIPAARLRSARRAGRPRHARPLGRRRGAGRLRRPLRRRHPRMGERAPRGPRGHRGVGHPPAPRPPRRGDLRRPRPREGVPARGRARGRAVRPRPRRRLARSGHRGGRPARHPQDAHGRLRRPRAGGASTPPRTPPPPWPR